MLEFIGALVLFAVGIRLSAFCSGTETGFYRLSLPRLWIDARAGDPIAARLLHFSQNPSQFVAACLVGNNIANYMITFSVGWGLLLLLGRSSELGEVLSTLLLAPFLFLAGEMVPKSLYYQIPYGRLRAEIVIIQWFYWILSPVTWPLVQITRRLEQWTGQGSQPVEIVLGRNRFIQLVQHGRQEGVLKDVQSRLANGLLQLAPQSVISSIIPNARVFGVVETMHRDEMLKVAKAYGMPLLPVRREQPDSWYGFVMVREIVAGQQPARVHSLPRIPENMSKLEALNILRGEHAPFAVVHSGAQTLGLVARQGLVEQLFRPDPSHRHV